MRRDLDLIREILLRIESDGAPRAFLKQFKFEHDDSDSVAEAIELLIERNLITAQKNGTLDSHPSTWFYGVSMTWEGHDFLDTVRDDEVWKKTKEGAAAAGGFTFDLVKALAKGLVKKKIEQHTGIQLEI